MRLRQAYAGVQTSQWELFDRYPLGESTLGLLLVGGLLVLVKTTGSSIFILLMHNLTDSINPPLPHKYSFSVTTFSSLGELYSCDPRAARWASIKWRRTPWTAPTSWCVKRAGLHWLLRVAMTIVSRAWSYSREFWLCNSVYWLGHNWGVSTIQVQIPMTLPVGSTYRTMLWAQSSRSKWFQHISSSEMMTEPAGLW